MNENEWMSAMLDKITDQQAIINIVSSFIAERGMLQEFEDYKEMKERTLPDKYK